MSKDLPVWLVNIMKHNKQPSSGWRQKATWLWRGWVRPLGLVILITSAMRSALADWNDVPSGSMRPTILEGDRVWVNKLAYDLKVPFTTWHVAAWGAPQRGEIVVFFSPLDGERLVKRVVGVPGDVVAMENNRLTLNNQAVTYEPMNLAEAPEAVRMDPAQPHLAHEGLPGKNHAVAFIPGIRSAHTFGPITVPDGHYFMMGDNRDNSFDSRYFGFVDRQRIVGRATSVALSVDKQRHYRPRWERWFRGLN